MLSVNDLFSDLPPHGQITSKQMVIMGQVSPLSILQRDEHSPQFR